MLVLFQLLFPRNHLLEPFKFLPNLWLSNRLSFHPKQTSLLATQHLQLDTNSEHQFLYLFKLHRHSGRNTRPFTNRNLSWRLHLLFKTTPVPIALAPNFTPPSMPLSSFLISLQITATLTAPSPNNKLNECPNLPTQRPLQRLLFTIGWKSQTNNE